MCMCVRTEIDTNAHTDYFYGLRCEVVRSIMHMMCAHMCTERVKRLWIWQQLVCDLIVSLIVRIGWGGKREGGGDFFISSSEQEAQTLASRKCLLSTRLCWCHARVVTVRAVAAATTTAHIEKTMRTRAFEHTHTLDPRHTRSVDMDNVA